MSISIITNYGIGNTAYLKSQMADIASRQTLPVSSSGTQDTVTISDEAKTAARQNAADMKDPSAADISVSDVTTFPSDEFLQPSWAESLSFGVLKTNGASQFVAFTGNGVSTKAQELASLMTETPVGVEMDLDGMSMEQLAKLCGGIGKQIDDAFAAGEISGQEYADLNKGLSAYASFMTEKAETEKAMWAVFRQTSEAVRNKIDSVASDQEVKNAAEQIRNSWTDKISEFLKANSYDRTVLNQMIELIRAGKSL